jgi:hypothetical protein
MKYQFVTNTIQLQLYHYQLHSSTCYPNPIYKDNMYVRLSVITFFYLLAIRSYLLLPNLPKLLSTSRGTSRGGLAWGGGGPTGGGPTRAGKDRIFFFFFFFFWVLPPFLGGGWSGVATGYLHSLR